MSKEDTDKKSTMKAALESHFADLLGQINKRFEQSSGQLQGLSEWVRTNLQGLQNKIRQVELNYVVMDIAVASLVELLEEKGIASKADYEKKTQEVYDRRKKPTEDKKESK